MQEVTPEETMVESAEQDDEATQAAAATTDECASRACRATLGPGAARPRDPVAARAGSPQPPHAIEKRCSLPLPISRRSWSWENRRKRWMPPWPERGRWWRRVRGRIESQIAGERVPSGAPVRGSTGVQRHVVAGEDSLRPDPAGTRPVSSRSLASISSVASPVLNTGRGNLVPLRGSW